MRKIVAAALAVGMAAMTVTGCSSSKRGADNFWT